MFNGQNMHNFKPPVYKGLQMTLFRFKGVDYNKQF